MFNYIMAQKMDREFIRDGQKPTIIRERSKLKAWGVTTLKHFTRIDMGYTVKYYANVRNPFHNLYRIDSRPQDDFVIHKVVR